MSQLATDDSESHLKFLQFCGQYLEMILADNENIHQLDSYQFNEPIQHRIIDLLSKFSTRYQLISQSIQQMAEGQYKVLPALEHESDQVTDQLKHLGRSHIELIEQMQSIIQGDFSQSEYARSNHDQLGALIEKIVENFQYVNWRVGLLSSGDCSTNIEPYSNKDELGIALKSLTVSLSDLTKVAEAVAEGDLSKTVEIKGKKDQIGHSINGMIEGLQNLEEKNQYQQWFKNTLKLYSDELRGHDSVDVIMDKSLHFFADKLGFKAGCFYLHNATKSQLELKSSYAFRKRKSDSQVVTLGEGLLGQAATEHEPVIYNDLPADYLSISSALGAINACATLIAPVRLNGELLGVFELADIKNIEDSSLELISESIETLAIAMNSAQVHDRMQELLNETENQKIKLQEQTDKLQANQVELELHQKELEQTNEELRVKSEQAEQTNEELRVKSEQVEQAMEELTVKSEQTEEANKKLKIQSDELKELNEVLEEKSQNLEQQQQALKQHNLELENAKQELTEKAQELADSSKYKSEFLANMSHELRTPLNSLMILAKMLADNSEGNLTEDQTESASVILNSGNELMQLINEILDLSKVEAGKMEAQEDDIDLAELMGSISLQFTPLAEEKGVTFDCQIDKDLPAKIISDQQRLKQILNNLLGNAFKFTSDGGVTLNFRKVMDSKSDQELIEFEVKDSGIGIPEDKIKLIFEAFQQADGSTSREFGGTGLGLTISKEMAHLLQGSIHVESTVGKGSRFILTLPIQVNSQEKVHLVHSNNSTEPKQKSQAVADKAEIKDDNLVDFKKVRGLQVVEDKPKQVGRSIKDDRNNIDADDKVILIIEDDKSFLRLLMNIANQQGYKCLTALNGQTGIELARKWKPKGILLDMGLPDIDGQKVIYILKDNPATKNVPIHIISGNENVRGVSGAIGYKKKPLSQEDAFSIFNLFHNSEEKSLKRLLIVEDDIANQKAISSLLRDSGLEIHKVDNGADAYEKIINGNFDCMILDLTLPDSAGLGLLDKLKKNLPEDKTMPAIVVYTAKELSKAEYEELNTYSDAIVIKGNNASERLLDEVLMSLNRVEPEPLANSQSTVRNLYNPDNTLGGKKVLLVDDDMRNTFAMSKLLKANGLTVDIAENGAIAVEKLEKNPLYDIVLMDIMMPVMDGFEATRKIRAMSQFEYLPVIALTAKAMPEDRKKCLDAGASDYVSKPVDISVLLSIMQIWLTQQKNVS